MTEIEWEDDKEAPYQTRNEQGLIQWWPTFRNAVDASKIDVSIWKISFDDSDGDRVRLLRKYEENGTPTNLWEYEPLW